MDGCIRYHFEITNRPNSKVYKSFQKTCEYLNQFHDNIQVVFQQKPTITNLQCGSLLSMGAPIRGELSVTLHHTREIPVVVWALQNVTC